MTRAPDGGGQRVGRGAPAVVLLLLTAAASPPVAAKVLADAAPDLTQLLWWQGAAPTPLAPLPPTPAPAAVLIAPDPGGATAALGIRGPFAVAAQESGAVPANGWSLPTPERSTPDQGLAASLAERSLAFQMHIEGLGAAGAPIDPVTGSPRVYILDRVGVAAPAAASRWWELDRSSGAAAPTPPGPPR